jgi:hypothetical protein
MELEIVMRPVFIRDTKPPPPTSNSRGNLGEAYIQYGFFSPLPLLEEIEIIVPTLAPPPTIIPQTTEVLSQVSKGIRLGALGLMEFLG